MRGKTALGITARGFQRPRASKVSQGQAPKLTERTMNFLLSEIVHHILHFWNQIKEFPPSTLPSSVKVCDQFMRSLSRDPRAEKLGWSSPFSFLKREVQRRGNASYGESFPFLLGGTKSSIFQFSRSRRKFVCHLDCSASSKDVGFNCSNFVYPSISVYIHARWKASLLYYNLDNIARKRM